MQSNDTALLPRKLAAGAVSTTLLLGTVAGSGSMAARLAGGDVAIALLTNTIATGAGLVAVERVREIRNEGEQRVLDLREAEGWR